MDFGELYKKAIDLIPLTVDEGTKLYQEAPLGGVEYSSAISSSDS
jgi:hypothetical protein